MPPAVGIDETDLGHAQRDDQDEQETTGQPIDTMTGPPLFHAAKKLVKQPASTEMIENEIAKLVNPPQERSSSCL